MEKNKIKFDLFIIIFFAALILFYNLGTGSLTSWDEAIYAGVSGEIIKSNNWLDLTWRGQAWSDKPPLCMWMTALFYKLFGINEFSARFFSALCGLGTVIITYFLAKKIYSRKVAFVASLILISTRHFIWSAKIGMLDSAFTFFITLSLFLFKLGEEKNIYLFFCAIAFAFAFFTKGVGALIIPLILFFYILFAKKLSMLKIPALWWGVFTAFVILAWWHWLAISHYGKGFIFGYFTKHLIVRTTQSVDGHVGGFFDYIKVIPNKGRPWGIFPFIIAPFILWRVVFKKEKEHIFILTWAVVVFMVASFVKTKLHWYIMPIYPVSSILVGWGIAKLFRNFTITAGIILCVASIFYLSSSKKSIFNLDYTPEAKRVYLAVSGFANEQNKILLYKISDPSMQFYCLKNCENLPDDFTLLQLSRVKGKYIILEKSAFNDFKQQPGINPEVIAESEVFTAIYSK